MQLKRISSLLASLLLTATAASAQVTIPNTFTPNTVAQSALVNANFSQLGQQALNRAGGIITGNISVDPGVTIDGIDIGAVLGGTGTPTFSTVTITGTGASALDVGGGINAGTGNVGIVDTTGKIPGISSTYFASLDGSNITNILEANIADGSLLARVAGTETITATWTFNASGTALKIGSAGAPNSNVAKAEYFSNTGYAPWGSTDTAGATDEKYWQFIHGANFISFRAVNDANSVSTDLFTLTRSGATLGTTTFATAMVYNAVISPATLSSGNNNNYAPSGNATAIVMLLTGNASNSVLTGISGGVTGRELYVCDTGSGGTIQISNNDSNSSAGNRFDLGTIAGNSPRLRSRTTASDYPGPCMHFMYLSNFWTLLTVPQNS